MQSSRYKQLFSHSLHQMRSTEVTHLGDSYQPLGLWKLVLRKVLDIGWILAFPMFTADSVLFKMNCLPLLVIKIHITQCNAIFQSLYVLRHSATTAPNVKSWSTSTHGCTKLSQHRKVAFLLCRNQGQGTEMAWVGTAKPPVHPGAEVWTAPFITQQNSWKPAGATTRVYESSRHSRTKTCLILPPAPPSSCV